eukprot:g11679.t1
MNAYNKVWYHLIENLPGISVRAYIDDAYLWSGSLMSRFMHEFAKNMKYAVLQDSKGDMPEEERLCQLRAIEEERHSAARNRWSLLQVPRVGPQTEEMMSAAEVTDEPLDEQLRADRSFAPMQSLWMSVSPTQSSAFAQLQMKGISLMKQQQALLKDFKALVSKEEKRGPRGPRVQQMTHGWTQRWPRVPTDPGAFPPEEPAEPDWLEAEHGENDLNVWWLGFVAPRRDLKEGCRNGYSKTSRKPLGEGVYGKVVEVTKDDEKFAMKIPKPLGIKENLHETLGAKLRAGKPVTGPKVMKASDGCEHVLPMIKAKPCVDGKIEKNAFVTKLLPWDLEKWKAKEAKTLTARKKYLDNDGCPIGLVLADFGMSAKIGSKTSLYENEDYEAAYHVPAGLFEGIDKDAFSSWDHGFSSQEPNDLERLERLREQLEEEQRQLEEEAVKLQSGVVNAEKLQELAEKQQQRLARFDREQMEQQMEQPNETWEDPLEDPSEGRAWLKPLPVITEQPELLEELQSQQLEELQSLQKRWQQEQASLQEKLHAQLTHVERDPELTRDPEVSEATSPEKVEKVEDAEEKMEAKLCGHELPQVESKPASQLAEMLRAPWNEDCGIQVQRDPHVDGLQGHSARLGRPWVMASRFHQRRFHRSAPTSDRVLPL